jgi:hypothetical protein
MVYFITHEYYAYDSYLLNVELFKTTRRLKEKAQLYAIILESSGSKFRNLFTDDVAVEFNPKMPEHCLYTKSLIYFVNKEDIDKFEKLTGETSDIAEIVYIMTPSAPGDADAKIVLKGPSGIGKSYFASCLSSEHPYYETDSTRVLDESLISSSKVIVLGNKHAKQKGELLSADGLLSNADVYSFSKTFDAKKMTDKYWLVTASSM